MNTSTLRPLHIAAMPPTRPATMPCLRSWVRAKLTLGVRLASMPNSAAWSTWRLHGRRLEERLRRDAAAVQAGAAERIHLDQRHLEAGRCAVQRSAVTAGPPPITTRSNWSLIDIHGIAPPSTSPVPGITVLASSSPRHDPSAPGRRRADIATPATLRRRSTRRTRACTGPVLDRRRRRTSKRRRVGSAGPTRSARILPRRRDRRRRRGRARR